MVDFRKHMSPEMRARLERRDVHLAQERARFQQLTNEELVQIAQQYIANCTGPLQHPAGEPVYDNAVWHIVLPELLARVGGEARPPARACTCAGGEAGGHDLDCERR